MNIFRAEKRGLEEGGKGKVEGGGEGGSEGGDWEPAGEEAPCSDFPSIHKKEKLDTD